MRWIFEWKLLMKENEIYRWISFENPSLMIWYSWLKSTDEIECRDRSIHRSILPEYFSRLMSSKIEIYFSMIVRVRITLLYQVLLSWIYRWCQKFCSNEFNDLFSKKILLVNEILFESIYLSHKNYQSTWDLNHR